MERIIETIRLVASVAPTQTAFQVHGAGDGARLILDVPQSHLAQALALLKYPEMSFELEITIRENQVYGQRNYGG